ncbi:MAG: hypothetical protein Q8N26_34530, partial [Myxococcales bacterium]|nr:hypothetical protein [Myxococcales bacterium]
TAGGAAGGGATAGGASGGGAAAGGAAGGGTVDGGTDGGTTSDAGTSSDAGARPDAGPTPVDAGCIRLVPDPVTFGAVEVGCRLDRATAVVNTCATPQVVSLSTAAPFFATPSTVTVPARGFEQVSLRFQPASLGAQQGVVSVSSPAHASTVSMSGAGATSRSVVQTFAPPLRPRMDVLFVVSDGPGMLPIQQALAQELTSFFRYATTSQLDLEMRVLIGRPDGGASVPLSAGLFNPQILLVGEAGAPTQSCLDRARDELLVQRWLRPNALFAVYCIQNTLEQPGISLASLLALRRTFGGVSTVVSARAVFAPCVGPHDALLAAAATSTGGELVSICGGTTTSPGGRPSNLDARVFPLSHPPELDAGVAVEIDGMSVQPNAPATNALVWSIVDGALTFEPLYEPEPGRVVTVRYTATCQ